MSKAMSLVVMGYAVCVAAGGITGYVVGGSSVSLTAGLISGSLAAIGGILIWMQQRLGQWIALATTLVLGLLFCYRFAVTGAFMPSGLMLILSFVTATAVMIGFRQKRKMTTAE